MNDPLPPGEKDRVGFAAIVLLLRQMAYQLIQDGRPDEARGLIDGIDALRAKSQGNLDAEEQQFLDDVLYQLRMEAVKAPAAGEAGPASDGTADGAKAAEDEPVEGGSPDRDGGASPQGEAPG